MTFLRVAQSEPGQNGSRVHILMLGASYGSGSNMADVTSIVGCEIQAALSRVLTCPRCVVVVESLGELFCCN